MRHEKRENTFRIFSTGSAAASTTVDIYEPFSLSFLANSTNGFMVSDWMED